MPGPDVEYAVELGQPDLYPQDDAAHAELLAWCQGAFTSADTARKSREEKWTKYHRVYRAFWDRGQVPTWRSAVFLPHAFTAIESITPRMVAQLPTIVCRPFGAEDVQVARLMELKLQHASEVTDYHVELVKAIKSSLKFGTGILKNYYRQDIRKAYERVPLMVPQPVEAGAAPVVDPATGEQMFGLDGEAVVDQPEPEMVEQPVMDPETGEPVMVMQPYDYLVYQGPASEWVDIFDFWVAPEAKDIDHARYTIQRSYRDLAYVKQKVAEGVYRLPPGVTDIGEMWREQDDGTEIRADVTGDTTRSAADTTRRPCELLEFWTDDGRVITMLNRQAVIRHQESPFWHGEKPYSVFPDYIQEGEFWGMGEIEAIEGLQDLANSIVNQRIDNVRLTMDKMFAINTKAIEDERDLVIRPGGTIRITGDWTPQEAIQPIDLGDVSASAFEEAAEVERMIERTSGVSAYQLGTGDEGVNRTATGVSLITEAGNSKFALKIRLFELTGLKRTARQWGAIVQQFAEENESLRLMGPNGQWLFMTMTPDSVQGMIDYTIEAASSTQNETVMKEQAMALLQAVSGIYPMAIPQLVKDLLEAFGKKNVVPYLTGMPDMDTQMQMMQAQEAGGTIVPFPQQPQIVGAGGQPQQGGAPADENAAAGY